jgi:hypothetical protein
MSRLKYAFIMMSKTMTPDDLTFVHENEHDYSFIASVTSVKMACDLAIKLAEENITKIDLCGAFNEAKTAKVKDAVEGRIDVRRVVYSPGDDERMAGIDSLSEFGIILMDDSIGETEWTYKKNEEYNTTIAFVNSLVEASSAAKRMVEEGIVFIEMCRWFDKDKAELVKKEIDEKVPVGYCG